MKQNDTETPVRGLREFLPNHRALAWAALIAAAVWLMTRNSGPCSCSLEMLARQPTANDSSQLASQDGPKTSTTTMTSAAETADVPATTASSDGASHGLPCLLDLGAGKCIPCKMMAPILDDLKDEYEGAIDVEFVDVWQHPELAREYGVKSIPTQIFLGGSGKELFRHVGFFAKEDILAKWKELGVNLNR